MEIVSSTLRIQNSTMSRIYDLFLPMMILLLVGTSLHAQRPPYDVFPTAEPPYYRVRYEASSTLAN